MKEVDDYGPLDRGEVSVPDEINGYVAFEKIAIVVFQCERILLNEFGNGG